MGGGRQNKLMARGLSLSLRLAIGFGACLTGVATGYPSWAEAPSLTYNNRTKAYSGYRNTISGNIRHIGLAGAGVGLADSFYGITDNPAGLGLLIDGIKIQITSNRIADGNVQSFTEPISANNFGIALSDFPWGFGLAVQTPGGENQEYRSSLTGQNIRPDIHVREFQLSVGRMIIPRRLSLGAGLILGSGSESLERVGTPSSVIKKSDFDLGYVLGSKLYLPGKFILGVKYRRGMEYTFDTQNTNDFGIADFFQPIRLPEQLGTGIGWFPNRFFQAGAALYITGKTPDTALLNDNARLIGERVNAQPRAGMSYRFMEFSELQGRASFGLYYELSRIAAAGSRWHRTVGLELDIWIFSVGWAFDSARQYRNHIYSGGINIVRFLRKLKLAPKGRQYDKAGFFPNPAQLSNTGLPRPINPEWRPPTKEEDPGLVEVGKQIPEKLQETLTDSPQKLQDLGGDLINTLKNLPREMTEDIKKSVLPDKPKKKKR